MGKLTSFYEAVMDEPYDADDFSNRIAMQQIVLLAESMGLNLGGYMFVSKDRGPYSLVLRLDVLDEGAAISTNSSRQIRFSKHTEAVIARLKDMVDFINPKEDFSKHEKYELVAAMLYLAKNECRYKGKEAVFDKLISWKGEQLPFANLSTSLNFETAWEKAESAIY